MPRQFLRQNNRDRLCVLGVNRNREPTGVAVVTVDRAVCFPNVIGMTSGMVDITNQKNFRPKVFLQGVLGFDRRQIVAGRDDATVENDEIVLAGIKHYVLATSADAIAGERYKKIDRGMAGDASFHKSGTKLLPLRGAVAISL